MKSFRPALLAGLCLPLLAAATVSAKAALIAPAPVPVRVATSDVVAVGKIVRIEDQSVVAPRFPGDTMPQEYRIAVLRIDDGISGTAGKKEVRIGFLSPTNPGGGLRPGGRGAPPVTFEAGEEVLVFLQPHFQAQFLTAPMYFHVARKADPTFEKDVAEARRCARLLEVPNVSLMAKSEEDRFLTAAMLLARYRTPPMFATATEEPVDPGQSQRILEILAESDWAAPGRQQYLLQPQYLFNQLGDKPGFAQPMDAAQFEAAAKKWLKANAGTFVLKRYVVEPQK